VVDCLADDTLMQTGHIMQQSGAAEVRISIKILYKFKGFGAKKLIREFSDKGWNVTNLNSLLKKLQDSGSVTR